MWETDNSVLLPGVWGVCACGHTMTPDAERCGWCGAEVLLLKPQTVGKPIRRRSSGRASKAHADEQPADTTIAEGLFSQ